MLRSLFMCAISMSLVASAQGRKHAPCVVPADGRENANQYLNRALEATNQVKQHFDKGQMFAQIAGGYTCLGEYKTAAKLGDEAYPSGSQAQEELGRVIALAGRTGEAPALEAEMNHGADSFLFGVVEGLVEKGDLEKAQTWAAKIPSAEVRQSAQAEIATAMYKAGRTDEALKRVHAVSEQMPANKKQSESPDEVEFGMAVETGNWSAAHRIWDRLPDGAEKRYAGTGLAAEEAEAGAADAEKDLLAAAQRFDGKSDPPFEGYMIAAHLAGLKNYAAAAAMTEKVRDDEWNRKCWTTIASFQAEDGKLAEAQASIARIGSGKLEHALGDEAGGRDDARMFVASGLAAQGKADAALMLLDAHEGKEDYQLFHMVPRRVQALAAKGDFEQTRALVERQVGQSPMADEE